MFPRRFDWTRGYMPLGHAKQSRRPMLLALFLFSLALLVGIIRNLGEIVPEENDAQSVGIHSTRMDALPAQMFYFTNSSVRLALSHQQQTLLLLSKKGQLMRSLDQGQTWSNISLEMHSSQMLKLSLHPYASDTTVCRIF